MLQPNKDNDNTKTTTTTLTMTAAFKIDAAITKDCFAFDEWDTQEQEESGTDYSFFPALAE